MDSVNGLFLAAGAAAASWAAYVFYGSRQGEGELKPTPNAAITEKLAQQRKKARAKGRARSLAFVVAGAAYGVMAALESQGLGSVAEIVAGALIAGWGASGSHGVSKLLKKKFGGGQ